MITWLLSIVMCLDVLFVFSSVSIIKIIKAVFPHMAGSCYSYILYLESKAVLSSRHIDYVSDFRCMSLSPGGKYNLLLWKKKQQQQQK